MSIIYSTSANETLTGSAGDDTYVFTDNNFGKDVINDSGGIDTIDMTAVTSRLTIDLTSSNSNEIRLNNKNNVNWTGNVIENFLAGSANDTITGNSANNYLDGWAGNDSIYGMGGNDTLVGGLGSDTLDGGDNDDTYIFLDDWSTDTLSDSSGLDTLDFTAVTAALTVDLTGSQTNDVTDGSNRVRWSGEIIETVLAGSGNDSLLGSAGDNRIEGNAGDDSLNGGTGNDTLDGGSGNDTYTFTDGWGNDTLVDSDGTDVLDFSLVTTALTVDLSDSQANDVTDGTHSVNWTGIVFETVLGGAGNDSIQGGAASELLVGNGGNDTLNGGGGNDTLDGGIGEDTYAFSDGWGADLITDSDGVARLDFGGVTGDLTINLGTTQVSDGTNSVDWSGIAMVSAAGGAGNDTLTGTAANNLLIGNAGADTLTGGAGDDTMDGGSGNDVFVFDTGWGNDTVTGGDGMDMLDFATITANMTVDLENGLATDGTSSVTWSTYDIDQVTTGSGNDVLTGNYGYNTLNGGAGDDIYLYSNFWRGDTIIDSSGNDTLDFSSMALAGIQVNLVSSDGHEAWYGEHYINWSDDAIENVIGTHMADMIVGNSAANNIIGGDGDDTLSGGIGSDTLDGGAYSDTYLFADGWGTDTIIDSGGSDTFDFGTVTTGMTANLTSGEFTDGTNTVVLTGEVENVYTGSGNDTLTASLADNTLDGGDGDDTYRFSNSWGQDLIIDASGSDTIDFSPMALAGVTVNLVSSPGHEASYATHSINWDNDAIEHVIGTAMDDSITGNAANNNLVGGDGYDTLVGGAGNDTLDGGAHSDIYIFADGWGVDTLSDSSGLELFDFSATTTGVTIDLLNQTASSGANALTWTGVIEQVTAGSGNDILVGNLVDNTLDGGAGDDTYRFSNWWVHDVIIDASGNDTIDFSPMRYAGVSVNLTSSADAEATYGMHTINWDNDAIENLIGTAMADTLTGNISNNLIIGGGGNDTIAGGGGNDTLEGGTWHDVYIFADGWGNDTVDESTGNGRDTFDFSTVTTNVTVDLLNATASDGSNSVTWTGCIEYVTTGSGDDILRGNLVNNILNGGDGNDTYRFSNYWLNDTVIDSSGTDTIDFSLMHLAGVNVNLTSGAGHEAWYGPHAINWDNDVIEHVIGTHMSDTITGNSADNNIQGGEGHDTLSGGTGNDTLLGGGGYDVYHDFLGNFGVDIVDDASSGLDIVDLSEYVLADVVSWSAVDTSGDTFVDRLALDFGSGNQILVENYFDNTSVDDDLSGAGTGLIETFVFADDDTVDFAQVQQLVS